MEILKKIFVGLLCAGLCFTGVPAFAAETKANNGAVIFTDMLTDPENASDYAEISGLTGEILNHLNDHKGGELSTLLTAKDINYSKAYKIYTGRGGAEAITIAELDQPKASNVIETLENASDDSYFWKLPIYADGQIIEVYISISKPLLPENESSFTPEEIVAIKAKVGQWHLSGYGFHTTDRLSKARNILLPHAKAGESYKITMTTGMPYFRTMTAIVSNTKTDTMESIIPVIRAFPVTAEDLKNFPANSPNISKAARFNSRIAKNQPLPYYETMSLISEILQ